MAWPFRRHSEGGIMNWTWRGLAWQCSARPGAVRRGTARHGMEHTLMSPFKPQGEIAQWRIAYDAFKAAAVGDEITYARLGELLSINPQDGRHRIQAAARQAAKKLLLTDDRAVETVPETGYRIVPAVRQIPMAGHQVE